jgi:capsule polysaccharide export protein KpsE/RkpR
MQTITTLAVFLMLTAATVAQVVDPHQHGLSQGNEAHLQLERFLWELEQRDSAGSRAQHENAERRAAEYQRLEFERRVNKVAALWNRLFEDYQRDRAEHQARVLFLEGVSRPGGVRVAQIG